MVRGGYATGATAGVAGIAGVADIAAVNVCGVGVVGRGMSLTVASAGTGAVGFTASGVRLASKGATSVPAAWAFQ